MNTKAARILRDALSLSAADRADIGACLLGSVQGRIADELDPEWDKELMRRTQEIDQGKAKLVTRKQAEQQIFDDA